MKALQDKQLCEQNLPLCWTVVVRPSKSTVCLAIPDSVSNFCTTVHEFASVVLGFVSVIPFRSCFWAHFVSLAGTVVG